MAVSTIVLCLSAVMVQSVYGQCLGPFGPGFGPLAPGPAAPGLVAAAIAADAALGLGPGLAGPLGPGLPGPLCPGLPNVAASNGGGFLVTSSSPISPNGISVQTDSMAIEGPLAVSGQLPFLGVVALEGPLPVAGSGAVAYGCGAGGIGILNEVGAGVGPFVPEIGPVGPGFGYGYPNGYGCGPYY